MIKVVKSNFILDRIEKKKLNLTRLSIFIWIHKVRLRKHNLLWYVYIHTWFEIIADNLVFIEIDYKIIQLVCTYVIDEKDLRPFTMIINTENENLPR